jgi:AraC-like DNA-binding protein
VTNQSVATVSSRWTMALLEVLVPDGSEGVALLASLSLPADLGATESRISQETECAVWAKLTDDHPDPAFGLHFAEAVPSDALGLLGLLVRCSPTLGEGLRRAVEFHALVDTGEGFRFEQHDDSVSIVEGPAGDDPPWPRHLAEAVTTVYLSLARKWSGTRISPVQVRFQHRAPADLGVHQEIFGCPVLFDQRRNELELPSAALGLPLEHHEPLLWAYLEPTGRSLAANLTEKGLQLAEIRRTITDCLPAGHPSAKRVAAELGISERTLHRRLGEQNLTYQDVADSVRRDAARALLSRGELTLTEVSYLVGYSDPRSFRRALRRWEERDVDKE